MKKHIFFRQTVPLCGINVKLKNMDHLQKRWSDPQRIPGVKDSSEMIEHYRDLIVWQKSYRLFWGIYRRKRNLKDGTAKVERILKALMKSLAN